MEALTRVEMNDLRLNVGMFGDSALTFTMESCFYEDYVHTRHDVGFFFPCTMGGLHAHQYSFFFFPRYLQAIRCFPWCTASGHRENNFCGSSLRIHYHGNGKFFHIAKLQIPQIN